MRNLRFDIQTRILQFEMSMCIDNKTILFYELCFIQLIIMSCSITLHHTTYHVLIIHIFVFLFNNIFKISL